MIEALKIIDTSLFLIINGLHNAFFDFIMYWASNKLIWILLYAFLLFLLYNHFKKQTIIIFLFAVALITCSDQLTSSLIKNIVERPRPSHNPALADSIHLVKDYEGGPYGFPSSHSSNSFALATFFVLLLMKHYRWIKFVMFPSILVAYSRIYLGVHYPSDVFCGMLIGILLGILYYKLLTPVNKIFIRKQEMN